MAVITTEKLGDTVGAQVHGVDRDQLLHDEALPAWTLEALEDNGALVFRDLHLDDEAQVAFSRKLGKVEIFGKGEHPEIFRVTLDPAKNPSAQYLRGTFDWHIDGCTDDIPIMATMLSAHAVAESGGETEFASSYAAYEMLDDDEKARLDGVRVVHTIEARSGCSTTTPPPRRSSSGACARPRSTRWCGGTARAPLARARRHHRPRRGHGPRRGPGPARRPPRPLHDPDRVYRHEWPLGDVVIWDNRGVLHRALPYDPTSPRDMHRTTFAGDEPIQ